MKLLFDGYPSAVNRLASLMCRLGLDVDMFMRRIDTQELSCDDTNIIALIGFEEISTLGIKLPFHVFANTLKKQTFLSSTNIQLCQQILKDKELCIT